MAKQHKELIEFLQKNDFKAICPSCDEGFKLKEATLFSLDEFAPNALDKLKEIKQMLKDRRAELKALTKNKRARVEVTTTSVNVGFILERLAPALQDFRFEKNDCRSLFDPIDYVIFEGLHKTGKVQKIIFTDIKSGDAKLKNKQKAIKNLVNEKKVEFKTYKP